MCSALKAHLGWILLRKMAVTVTCQTLTIDGAMTFSMTTLSITAFNITDSIVTFHNENNQFDENLQLPYFIFFYNEYDAEIFPAHYTWREAEKGFKMASMKNKLAMIHSCEIILEK